MDLDVKKTLEALLLSTTEPIREKDFLRVFERYRKERAEEAEDTEEAQETAEDEAAASGEEPEASSGEVPVSAGGGDNAREAGGDGRENVGDAEAGAGPDAQTETGAEEAAGGAAPVKEEQDAGRVTRAGIREALGELMRDAEAEDRAYRVLAGPNGYRIVTAPRFADYVRLLRGAPRPIKLSPAALETLSITAYRQPVTRAEMEAIRGVSVDSALNKLLELDLVRVTGRAELPGRPLQYGTTDAFLEFLGIKDLDQLPASDVLSHQQIDAWMRGGENEEEGVSDGDVGLREEPDPGELPLNETYVEVEWQSENAESNEAGDRSGDGGGDEEPEPEGREREDGDGGNRK